MKLLPRAKIDTSVGDQIVRPLPAFPAVNDTRPDKEKRSRTLGSTTASTNNGPVVSITRNMNINHRINRCTR